MSPAARYLSQADLARELGVGRHTVNMWRSRYPDFPEVQWNFKAEEEKIARLARVVASMDSATPPPRGIATIADLNRLNTQHYAAAPPPAPFATPSP